MRRVLCILLTLSVIVFSVQAQDAKKLVETFRRNFAIASLDVKIQILQDASNSKSASEMGPLHQQAIDFVIDNASLLPSDARFRQLAGIAATQLAVIGYAPSRYSVWKLFTVDSDTTSLSKAAEALGTIAVGDAEIIGNLNHYMEIQNTFFVTGRTPDIIVVASVIKALGRIGDPSSFSVIFSSMNTGYPSEVTAIARDALLSIKGDYKDMILDIVRNRPLPEKRLALQLAVDGDKLSDDQKSQVAEFALDVGLHTAGSDVTARAIMRDLRFISAKALGARKWTKATPLLIEHLDMSISELEKGLIDKNKLLDAISSLGAMGSHEAAVRLTQYLVLINSYTEKSKGYDEGIVITTLENIGALGDKVAFDDLMYTQYLNYSTAVKKAARAALDKLNW